MEKPDDLTLPECQKAFAMFRLHKAKTNFDLIMTLANRGLWHICEQIFGYLNYENVENLYNKSSNLCVCAHGYLRNPLTYDREILYA